MRKIMLYIILLLMMLISSAYADNYDYFAVDHSYGGTGTVSISPLFAKDGYMYLQKSDTKFTRYDPITDTFQDLPDPEGTVFRYKLINNEIYALTGLKIAKWDDGSWNSTTAIPIGGLVDMTIDNASNIYCVGPGQFFGQAIAKQNGVAWDVVSWPEVDNLQFIGNVNGQIIVIDYKGRVRQLDSDLTLIDKPFIPLNGGFVTHIGVDNGFLWVLISDNNTNSRLLSFDGNNWTEEGNFAITNASISQGNYRDLVFQNGNIYFLYNYKDLTYNIWNTYLYQFDGSSFDQKCRFNNNHTGLGFIGDTLYVGGGGNFAPDFLHSLDHVPQHFTTFEFQNKNNGEAIAFDNSPDPDIFEYNTTVPFANYVSVKSILDLTVPPKSTDRYSHSIQYQIPTNTTNPSSWYTYNPPFDTDITWPLKVGVNTLQVKMKLMSVASSLPVEKIYTFNITRLAPAATGISSTTNPLFVTNGGSGQLTINLDYDNNTKTSITSDPQTSYSSSDASITTVDATGMVTAINPAGGSCNVTVTYDTFNLVIPVTVMGPPMPSSFSINPSSVIMEVGETYLPNFIFTPTNCDKTLTFIISDPTKISIDPATYAITALAPTGYTSIQYKTINNRSYFMGVTVNAPDIPVTGITVTPDTLNLDEWGASQTVTAVIEPVDATNQGVSWLVVNGDTSVSISPSGQSCTIVPMQAGNAVVRATSQVNPSVYVDVNVTVEAPVATEGTIIIKYQDIYGNPLAPDTFRTKSFGTYTINAVNIDGYDVIGSNQQTVTLDLASQNQTIVFVYQLASMPVKVTGVEVQPNSAEVGISETYQYRAIAQYDDGSTQDATDLVTWIISDPSVAVVNNGLVTGSQIGETSAIASFGGYNYAAGVKVVDNAPPAPVPTEIVINPDTVSLIVGQSQQINATERFSDGAEIGINNSGIWTVDNTCVIVENGLVTAVSEGTAIVKVEKEGFEAFVTVTVNPPVVIEPEPTPTPIPTPPSSGGSSHRKPRLVVVETPKVVIEPPKTQKILPSEFLSRYPGHMTVTDKPVKIENTQDVTIKVSDTETLKKAVNSELKPKLYRYNETHQKWLYVGGSYDGINTVTDQNQSTGWYAVFCVKMPDFVDVSEGHWAYSDIDMINGLALVEGYGTEKSRKYKPENNITRAEFITITTRLLGYQSEQEKKLFDVVTPSESLESVEKLHKKYTDEVPLWCQNNIAIALKEGLLEGFGNEFKGNKAITRAEVIEITKAALSKIPNADTSKILVGDAKGLRLSDTITRAETATILIRTIKQLGFYN